MTGGGAEGGNWAKEKSKLTMKTRQIVANWKWLAWCAFERVRDSCLKYSTHYT